MTILEENHHSLLIVEHDPLLCEDAERRMMEYLAQALGQTSKEATVLLYAPALDPHLQKIAGHWPTGCSVSTTVSKLLPEA